MLYNANFIVHGILLLGFILASFNGITILLAGYYTNPFNRKSVVEGWKAVVSGILLVMFGIWCLISVFHVPSLDQMLTVWLK